jgi:hypothetical protein
MKTEDKTAVVTQITIWTAEGIGEFGAWKKLHEEQKIGSK